MSICGDCGKTNYDEARELARQEAKTKAIEQNETFAIWKEGGEWFYGPASIAIANGKPIAEYVSHLP